jgi:peptidoglycan/LPS O-acetylase OafA/YrhL
VSAIATTGAPARQHIQALDGLRGIAIVTVLMYHSFPDLGPELGALGHTIAKAIELGPFGVDLFFVLSGFLITGILIDARDEPHYFRNFYARRALRLFPIYYLHLAVLALVIPRVYELIHTSIPTYKGDWWWYLLYFGNWKSNWGQSDPGLAHIWSLAVEEQFYLVWPTIVLLSGPRRLAYVCAALIVQATILRCVWASDAVPWNQVYRLTITRYDTMAFGALVALALRSERYRPLAVRWARPLAIGGAMAFVGIAMVAGGVEWERVAIQTFGTTAASVTFTGLVILAATGTAPRLNRILLRPMLLRYGKYSYFIYLVHGMVLVHVGWVGAAVMKRAPLFSLPLKLLFFVLGNALVFYLATLSWRYIEAPLLTLKRRFEGNRTSVSSSPATVTSA